MRLSRIERGRGLMADELAAWRAFAQPSPGIQALLRAACEIADARRPSRAELEQLAALAQACAQSLASADQPAELPADRSASAAIDAAAWARLLRHLALELAAARQLATRKWPQASTMLGDRSLVEQASAARVASWKAERFVRHDFDAVVDLCSGLGGDAWALAQALGPDAVRAVDRDARAALFTEHNSGLQCFTQELEAGLQAARQTFQERRARASLALHIDPARRSSAGRRGASLAALEPSLGRCLQVAQTVDAVCIKLAPGSDTRELAEHLRSIDGPWELEFVAEPEGLVQALLWLGALVEAPASHTATRIHSALDEPLSVSSMTGQVRPLPQRPLLQYLSANSADCSLEALGLDLLRIDPVLERAQLTATWASSCFSSAAEIHPGLGLCTVEHAQASAGPRTSPGAPGFQTEIAQVVALLPWRLSKLRKFLRVDGRPLRSLRTRGAAIDIAATRRELPMASGKAVAEDGSWLELWGLRFGKRRFGLFTSPRPPGPSPRC